MAEDIERVTPAQIEQLRKSFHDKVVSTNAGEQSNPTDAHFTQFKEYDKTQNVYG